MFQVLKDAIKLDIHDLNYTFTGENFQYTMLAKSAFPKSGIIFRISVFIVRWLKSLWNISKSRRLFDSETPPLIFFASSQNQEETLQPIFKKMQTAYFVGVKGFGNEEFPMFMAYTVSFFFLPLIFYRYWQAAGDTKKSYRYFFDLYWLSYGYVVMARWFFRKTQPSGLIMANDHVMWTRALLMAAREEGVPSIYIQHASVTERFPPLTFDYAFLEGVDAVEKYAQKGKSDTQVYLVGMASFDKYRGMINRSESVCTLGICINFFETIAQIEELAAQFETSLPNLSCTLRPHPADTRESEWLALAKRLGWEYSNSEQENIFVFLNNVDAILAGDSNVHLEAALLNVYPIYFDFSKKKMDWYGFYRNGLVVYCDDGLECTQILRSLMQVKPNVRPLTTRYCETVGTKYDGLSTNLIASLLYAIIPTPDQLEELDGFQLVKFDNLTVYRLYAEN